MTGEPVATVEAVRVLLAAAVGLGWVTLDEPTVMAVATGVAVLISVGGSVWARARVTPLARRWFDRDVMIPTDESGGLQIASPTWQAGSRRVRPHDGGPARDVPRRVGIGTLSVGAANAAEVVPGGTVPLVDVSAPGAFPRGVTGVHQHDRDTGEGRLVPDEGAQLTERP